MKPMKDFAIRQALIASGAVDNHKRPEPIMQRRVNKQLSRVNAILARRATFKQVGV